MPTGKMKVLFLSANNAGVKFYRFYQYAEKMSELGLAHCRIFPDFEPKRVNSDEWELQIKDNLQTIEDMVDWSDIVVCQYVHTPLGLSVVEGIRDLRPCLMEVDDNVGFVPGYSAAFESNRPGEATETWSIRQAIESDGIITTTHYLKKFFSKWNDNIHVVPNCVNTELYDKYNCQSNGKIRIGWIGGSNHDGDLKLIKGVIYEIIDSFPEVEVYIVGPPPPDLGKKDRLILKNEYVTILEFPQLIKNLSYNIGLAPLRDNEFNRGKSNLRFLEYSACKIPTVASHVEPFKNDFIGYTANTEEDWLRAISHLIKHKEMRQEIGERAYSFIKEQFNLETISREYAKILQDMLK